MVRLVVSSFGGVGSKCLVKGLLQTEDKAVLGMAHTHLRVPPPKHVLDGRTMIYIFGDPYNAVVSFFKRRTKKTRSHGFNTREGDGDVFWAVNHCRNIGGEHEKMNPQWDLAAYLDNGVELFRIEEHFHNWVNAITTYPILFVRYETMWQHLGTIFEFVGLPGSAVSKFPPRESRGSRWEDEPEPIKLKLKEMYGRLGDNISAAPDLWIGGNGANRISPARR